jgi:hypothetical protein
LRRLLAEKINGAIFFQLIGVRTETPDSQLRDQPLKFVTLKIPAIHDCFLRFFVLLILIYILSMGLSSIIFDRSKKRNVISMNSYKKRMVGMKNTLKYFKEIGVK